MDRLTLTMYAEQQPARAMKWWKRDLYKVPGWSKNCWCAACANTLADVSAHSPADAADYTDVDYCIRCHTRLEFTDGPSHADPAG